MFLTTRATAPSGLLCGQGPGSNPVPHVQGFLVRLRVPRDNPCGPDAMLRVLEAVHALGQRISLEVAALRGDIYLQIWLPSAGLLGVFGRVLASAYPGIQIEAVEALLPASSCLVAAEMRTARPSAVPLVTFSASGGLQAPRLIDPFSTTLLGLASAREDVTALYQLVLQPVQSWGWRRKAHEVARAIREGRAGLPSATQTNSLLVALFGRDRRGPASVPAERRLADDIDNKAQRPLFQAAIRLLCCGENKGQVVAMAQATAASMSSLDSRALNRLVPTLRQDARHLLYAIAHRLVDEDADVLCPEEVALAWHPLQAGTPSSPTIWLASKIVPAPSVSAGPGVRLGHSLHNGARRPVILPSESRTRHVALLGGTGGGKTTDQAQMIRQDLEAGHGLAVLEPKSDLTDLVLALMPAHRIADVVLLDPADLDFPMGLNPLAQGHPLLNDLACSDLVAIFRRLFPDSWGPRLELILRCSVATLQAAGLTLAELTPLLTDDAFRAAAVSRVEDPFVLDFWESLERMSQGQRQLAVQPVITRVGTLLSNPIIRNMMGQQRGLNFRHIMDSGKVLIAPLIAGKIGEHTSNLLGSIIASQIQLAAMARAFLPAAQRRPFYLYVDEFQHYTTPTFVRILSEARSMGLGLCLANQFLGQLPEDVRNAVLGNVGTLICFRLGEEDAHVLGRRFAPQFSQADLLGLPNFQACVRMLVGGVMSDPFTLFTEPLTARPDPSRLEAIRESSRRRYATPREEVEAAFAERRARFRAGTLAKDDRRRPDIDEE